MVSCFCNYQPREDVPTITTPVYLQHKLKKCKQKLEARDLAVIRAKTKQGNKRYPIITCKRPEFNCYMGHVLAKGEEVKLASGGWLHYKSKGDYFTIHRLTPVCSSSACYHSPANVSFVLTDATKILPDLIWLVIPGRSCCS